MINSNYGMYLTMKKDVTISIKGLQTISEDEDDVFDFFTDGILSTNNGKHVITYNESDLTGINGTKTTVSIENQSKVTITRTGDYKSHLILELGKRHLCPYETPYGSMMMGVSTNDISCNITAAGGTLSFDYDFELNYQHASRNKMKMLITPM